MTDLRIARLAAAALVEEVYTTPKPGLVDLNNTGAHRDMTVQTFLYSAAALQPYFREMAELGRTLPQEALLPALDRNGRLFGSGTHVCSVHVKGCVLYGRGSGLDHNGRVQLGGCLNDRQHHFHILGVERRNGITACLRLLDHFDA